MQKLTPIETPITWWVAASVALHGLVIANVPGVDSTRPAASRGASISVTVSRAAGGGRAEPSISTPPETIARAVDRPVAAPPRTPAESTAPTPQTLPSAPEPAAGSERAMTAVAASSWSVGCDPQRRSPAGEDRCARRAPGDAAEETLRQDPAAAAAPPASTIPPPPGASPTAPRFAAAVRPRLKPRRARPPAALAHEEALAANRPAASEPAAAAPGPPAPPPAKPAARGTAMVASLGAPPPLLAAPAEGDPADAELLGLLHEEIARHKRYPRLARRQHREGTATVRFTLDPAGSVAAVSIGESSGHAGLDRAALAAVTKVAPFAPARRLLRRPADFKVEVTFSLR